MQTQILPTMSTTKKNLLMVLKQEIIDLRPEIIQMNEQALLKQLAKQKVVYNLSKKSNELQLVYAYMALSEYYIKEQFYEPAIKNLISARQIRQTGDVLYMLGVCHYKTDKIAQAAKNLQEAMRSQWIQPSIQHQKSSLLEGISYLQNIYFQKAKKYPEKKPIYQQKLINLSYEKIKFTQQLNEVNNKLMMSQNYYYALAMADLAEIFNQFGEHQMSLTKIKTAISMIHEHGYGSTSNSPHIICQYRDKLVEFYNFQFLITQKLGLQGQGANILNDAMRIIKMKHQDKEETDKKINYGQTPKLTKLEQQIYYQYIKQNLGI